MDSQGTAATGFSCRRRKRGLTKIIRGRLEVDGMVTVARHVSGIQELLKDWEEGVAARREVTGSANHKCHAYSTAIGVSCRECFGIQEIIGV